MILKTSIDLLALVTLILITSYVTAKQIKFNCYSFQQTRDAKFNIHYYILKETLTRRALDGAHVPPTKVFPRLAVNKTILKPRLAAATGAQYLYVVFFPT